MLFLRRAIFASLILVSSGLFAEQELVTKEGAEGPWLTGTLLAPVVTVVTAGSIVIQPFLYVMNTNGPYDPLGESEAGPNLWSINPSLQAIFGLTNWMDLTLIPQVFYQETSGGSAVEPGDTTFGFDFQLFDGSNKKAPSVLFFLYEILPTGHYQRLDPFKRSTDATGKGSWTTLMGFTFYKIVPLPCKHYMRDTLDISYAVPSSVSVNGFNAYGGSPKTSGKVHPGNYFTTILSFEYTLTKNWVLALDNLYIHNNSISFKGTTARSIGNSSSDQISLAPAIEYNFSQNLGLIAGAWFTVWSRKTSSFVGGVISLSYVYSS